MPIQPKNRQKVVLVHGIFNTGRVMGWMRKQLEADGFECFVPTLKPIDGRDGIESASYNLKQQILARFGDSQPISIVGFSMGGVVARYYLQRLGGAGRTRCFFALSTPHRGSYMAYIPYPSKGMKQLRPGSELLRALAQCGDTLAGVKLYSYWTSIDFTIVPNSSSYWALAENRRFVVPLHLTMIFSRKIVDEISARLKGSESDDYANRKW